MKRFQYIQVILALISIIILFGCVKENSVRYYEYSEFPQGEFTIVYQTMGVQNDSVGFFSGRKDETQLFENNYPIITPFYFSNEGLLTAIQTRGFRNDPSTDIPGYVKTYISIPPYKECWGPFSEEIHPYGDQLASLSEGVIQIYDPEMCKGGEVIFSQESFEWDKDYIHVRNFSIIKNNPNLILSISLGDTISLFRVNLETKEIADYKTFGINPALSPDGKKIAYFSYNGIRIMNIDGEENFQITQGASWDNSNIENWSKPVWSANGENLIYHKCNLSGEKHCPDYSDYSIFIYDVSTKTEEKIIDFGINPSWVINK